MFFGEFHYLMDKKGRVPIPPKFWEDFGEETYLAECPDGCLYFIPLKNWKEVKKELGRLTQPKKIKIEKSWKILIPLKWRELAKLEREVIIVGCGDRLEIWNPNRWKKAKREDEKEKIAIFGK